MKKLVLCGALMASCAVQAGTEMYVGAGVAADLFHVKRDTKIDYAGPPSANSNLKHADAAASANISVGLRYSAENYYLSGELDGAWSAAKISATTINYEGQPNNPAELSIKKNGTLRVSLLPGFYVTDKSAVFGRIGYARTGFEFKAGSVTGGDYIPDGTNAKETLSGFVLGAGLSTNVSNNTEARLEYNYTNYASRTFNGLTPNIFGETITSTFKPIDHSIALSVIVKFPV